MPLTLPSGSRSAAGAGLHRTGLKADGAATARLAGSIITEVAGSHVSMVSHPAAAIDAILAAMAAIGD
jgi:hypothetical protein